MPGESAVVSGLSEAEAASRSRAEGPKELPRAERRGLPRFIQDVVRKPMFGLLIGAGAINLLLGELGEALILLAVANRPGTTEGSHRHFLAEIHSRMRDLKSMANPKLNDDQNPRSGGIFFMSLRIRR